MTATPETPMADKTPYVLGLDCVFKYKLSNVDDDKPALAGAKTMRLVDVSWDDDLERTDVTDREAGGFKQEAPTLRTLSVKSKMFYDPTSDSFNELYAAYAARKRLVVFVGDDRGNYFCFVGIFVKFAITQNLTEAVSAELEIVPARGGFNPQWIAATAT